MEQKNLLPFFVYGTLLEGESNHHLLEKVTVSCRAARIEGFAFFDLGPYPMIVEGEGTVIGEVVEIDPAKYESALKKLDRLEGVDGENPEDPNGLYRRVTRKVTLDGTGEQVEVWIYVGRDATARRGVLKRGDWRNRFEKDGS